ncbi:hypothetical protein Fmac_006533 [Flemingia macrophylla]|uniref:Senescence regulator n=1 Tax=Flemingia macrophylla TaxID=520843 RepID=A0ABD1NBC9_9FABA
MLFITLRSVYLYHLAATLRHITVIIHLEDGPHTLRPPSILGSPPRALRLLPFALRGGGIRRRGAKRGGALLGHRIGTPKPRSPQPKSRFDRPVESGILVVLNDGDSRRSVFPSPSSSRMIPSLPRPPPPSSDYLVQSAPSRKFQQSAPVKVPIILSARRRNAADDFDGALDDDDDEMLPPHELVARGSGVSPKTTFSVLEGVGRTLKGRDLRQVRNAVLRKTGFLD